MRSEPDELVRMFVGEVSRGEDSVEVPLHEGEVDYGRLVEEVFRSDRVISWW